MWRIEGATNYSPNMVSFTITVGRNLWYIVSFYLPANDQPSVRRVEQSLAHCLEIAEIFIMGDLNAWIERPRDRHEEELAIIIVAHGMEDQVQQFLPWSHHQGTNDCTWRM